MQLVRLALDKVSCKVEGGKPAASVAASICHVEVEAQIPPTRREGLPIPRFIGRTGESFHIFARAEGKSCFAYLLYEFFQVGG